MKCMEYGEWMKGGKNRRRGGDVLREEEMEEIEGYLYDGVKNVGVFVGKEGSRWEYGNWEGGKYGYCGKREWMKEM